MPMMVMPSATAAAMCQTASHQPHSTNHTMLPMRPSVPVPKSSWPVSSLREITSRPKGQKENIASVKQERTQGMPMMVIAMRKVANSQPRPEMNPPKMNHNILSNRVMPASL